ncbi:2-deoxy-scyllo-inosose synthase [Holophaga foetida]|uniref:2-deoxy-scyllo-inosose synthase n=1 Tax=Holophaga foetida TaxID=35839 RepID=UPI0002474603|nr:2-deoxy-scyllo-inosose synthase [Holophaga foetida]
MTTLTTSSSISFREISSEPGVSHLLAAGEMVRLKTHLIPDPPYYFGNRITGQLGGLIKEQNPDRVYLVTNQMLLDLYGAELQKSFPENNLNVTVITIEDTEETKTFKTLEHLCETLVGQNVSKASLVIGFGGGCLTNIVGLASAMIFRGIRYVEIPTTLMGVTDSSLSNKQAVNGRHGKNQFGVYYGPVFLFGDTQFLMSEPVGGKKSAIVEGIKNGWISDPSLVDYFEAKLQTDLKDYTEQDITELSLKIILSKLEILKADPTEKKLGMILEYGHTFGHAMEFITKGAITHGMAVAKGMCIAAELGNRLGYISREVVDRHYRIFGETLGLDLNIPANVSVEEMLHVMVSDNKKTLGGTKFVLLERVGKCLNPDGDYQVKVPAEIVKAILDEYKQR